MNLFVFILALLPILWLIVALTLFKWPTFKAAIGSLIISAILAITYWQMPIIDMASALAEGFAMAVWPIIIVIIAAVFTYNLTLRTGAMEIIKQMIASVSSDRRIIVLLIAWCFGGFMEGMAGFGTAIAIPASMLVGLGFKPLFSCLVCLLANGVPTPFGSIGIPTVTLANLVGLENTSLSFMTSLQLSPFVIAAPFLIVMATGKGPKALKGMVPLTLASGLGFIIPQLAVSYFVGAELAVVVGSVCSLLLTILFALKKKPDPQYAMQVQSKEKITLSKAITAWSPFILIFCFLLLTSKLVAPVNEALSVFSSQVTIYTGPDPNLVSFSWINTPGVWIFLSAILGGWIQKAKCKDFIQVLIETLQQMKETMITMLCVLACAKIMGYAGMISDISSFVILITGSFYPFFAPWFGALGTFVTGSGTNSGVLFGQVQMEATQALQANNLWIVALNSLGVAVGKMLSPQSLAIALSSVDSKGQDSKLLSMVLPYGAIMIILMSILAFVGNMIL